MPRCCAGRRSAHLAKSHGTHHRRSSCGTRGHRIPRSLRLARRQSMDAHRRLGHLAQRRGHPSVQLAGPPPPDLRPGTYLRPLIEGAPTNIKSKTPVDTGDMWECPDFFPLGDKHVLLVSTMGKVRWKGGASANQRFAAEKEGVVDWGSYYAAKTMLDADGNRILWGWIPETRPDAELIAAGWAGVMSLPRVLSLNAQNELPMEVAPVARQLRATLTGINPEQNPAMRQRTLDSLRIHDLAAELKLELVPKADKISIHLQSETGQTFA